MQPTLLRAARLDEFRDLNPLDYFRELGTFSRLLLLVAFVLLFAGIAEGVTVHNPILITAVALIFLSLALHYLSDARELHPNPPPNSFWNWGKLIGGFVCLLLMLVTVIWLFQTRFGDRAPWWVKAFWVKVVAAVWGQ